MTNLNIYPTTTERTEKIDDTHTLMEKQWTIGGYTLVRSRYASDKLGTGKSTWTVRAAHRDLPEITDVSTYGARLPKYGVNWASMGARSVKATREYSELLKDAARVAERFTLIAEWND